MKIEFQPNKIYPIKAIVEEKDPLFVGEPTWKSWFTNKKEFDLKDSTILWLDTTLGENNFLIKYKSYKHRKDSKYDKHWIEIYFKSESDAMRFKLVWG